MIDVNVERVKRAVKGDKSAFSEIIHERRRDIYKLAYVYMKNEEDAMDVLNDTVYRAFISIKKLNNPEYFNTWLTRILINCSLNALKKRDRIVKNEVKEFDEDICIGTMEADEDSIISKIDLVKAIELLEFNEKTVVMLKYFQDFTLSQISEILSCPLGTVKTRLHKALKLLRADIEALI